MNNNAAMDRLSAKHILEWEEEDVHVFMTSLGFPQFQDRVVEDRITGDILVLFDAETLKDYGLSIGQRLTVLKGIYQVKLAYGIEICEEDWVPPSESLMSPTVTNDSHERDSSFNQSDLHNSMSSNYSTADLDRLSRLVNGQDERIQKLESDNTRLFQLLTSLMEDFAAFRADHHSHSDTSVPSISHTAPSHSGLDRKPSFQWGSLSNAGGKSQVSPTKSNILEINSPNASPTFPPGHTNGHATNQPRKQANEPNRNAPVQPLQPQRPSLSTSRADGSDNALKSFKVSLEDPTWKVLPAALKKYKINNDNWQNYAMFICYGSTGNRIERCLSYDEKPLLLFQKLKDAKKNPVFMLKHIKDIRSPIVVAQQKHALRKANSIASNDGAVGQTTAGGAKPRAHRPPKLAVHDLSTAPPGPETGVPGTALPGGFLGPSTALLTGHSLLNTASGGGGGWPSHHELTSPSTEQTPHPLTASSSFLSPHPAPPASSSSGREHPSTTGNTQVSYAVAIYPYMSEQEDEFDVIVGDTFVILSRARGWWVVQRDTDGSGMVKEGTGPDGEALQGWVPAGCLLETSVPVATAVAEAESSSVSKSKSNGSNELVEPDTPRDVLGFEDSGQLSSDSSPVLLPRNKAPILPLNIISTSFPGIALMEYRRKGDEELDLEKDDKLRVFKRYNHWSYAVKEEGGDRGWVPSWFIGKVASGQTGGGPTTALLSDDQVSPMSSAFPVTGPGTSTGKI